MFASISWTAVSTKNATVDEPGHALSGWLMWRYGDFRLAPENPSLWQLYAALPNVGCQVRVQFNENLFSDRSFDSQGGINWVSSTLYRSSQFPGNDGESLVRRSRAMMLVLGVLLGLLIAYWARQLAGNAAAICAVSLFSLDPNFIAHAPMVKSDVSLALVMLLLAYNTWRMGQQATWWRAIAVAVLCGIGMNTKFSGLLLLPVTGVLLLARAMSAADWPVLHRTIHTRIGRLLATCGFLSFTICVCVLITWAAYGFRFRPSHAESAQMDMPAIRARAIQLEAGAAFANLHMPTDAEKAGWKPSVIVRCVDFADRHRLLPQAMLGGFLYQHACMQIWPAYLMGRLYGMGPWWYFPVAMAVKTPLATLGFLALAIAFSSKIRRRTENFWWSAACVGVPFCLFAFAALQSNLTIGIRSVLPLYPFLFIACGAVAGSCAKKWPRRSAGVLIAIFMGLSVETLSAWPNYISFFNPAAGGQRGGFYYLGDSNLDWGQDLKALVQWQHEHPGVPIYLHYFGSSDPSFMGLHFRPLEMETQSLQPGVLAVSVNYLQGLFDQKNDIEFYRRLGSRPPDEIVGGSIYLYRYPLR